MDIRNLAQIVGNPLDRPRTVNQYGLAHGNGEIIGRFLARGAGRLRRRLWSLSLQPGAGAED
jgi:hypothetical protein